MPTKVEDGQQIKGTNASVSDFWRWGYSDLLSNRNRGIFAEFLVGHALGLTKNPRIEWDKADLEYCGKFIEVKSSAYIQSWYQEKLSRIEFGISKAKAWDPKTGEYSTEAKRNSDCYVFCVYTDQDKTNYDILQIKNWEFYVVSTTFLNENHSEQKKISLTTLIKNFKPVHFGKLKTEIDNVLGFIS